MIIGFGMSSIYAFTSKLQKLIVTIMIKNNSFLFLFFIYIFRKKNNSIDEPNEL